MRAPTSFRHGDSFLIREISPDLLFIGNAMDARDLQQLYEHRITAVVDLAANEPPAQLNREMLYCRIPIIDGDGNSHEIIEIAVRCVVTLFEKEFRTLIACRRWHESFACNCRVGIAIVTKQPPGDCLTAIISGLSHDVSPALWSAVQMVYNDMIGN